jgi:cell division protein FtsI/penicillin-binding protein 2
MADEAEASTSVELGRAEPVGKAMRAPAGAGRSVVLTLDPRLQREADRLLDASKAPSGAVAVADARTGRMLAWATRGPEGDLVRRARYPGASLFKIVTAAALLEKGAVKPGQSVCFGGGESKLEEADVRPGCHPGDARARFDAALGKSINGVFGKLALEHLSAAELDAMAKRLGVGQAPPIDVEADRTRIVIPPAGIGLARAAAGFGDARMSVLGALHLAHTIANGGERVGLQVLGAPEAVVRRSLGVAISPATSDTLRRMLEKGVRSGTSAKAFRHLPDRPSYTAAGKTGTLMVASPNKRLVSWFAGFAPSRQPEFVVSVLLANDERWWRKANEVARDVLDACFAARPRRVAKRR